MFVIWSGWGVLVAVFAVVALFVGIPVGEMLPGSLAFQRAIGFMLSGVLAGLACFLFARFIETRRPPRTFIDKQTGQEIQVKPSAGSLFFIPTRWWAILLPVIGIVFGAWCLIDRSPFEPVPPTSVAPAAVDAQES